MLSSRLLFAGTLCIGSPAASAFESDVHYGMTFWLAAQAGFPIREAHEIARSNELTDAGMLDAKHRIIWGVCMSRDHKEQETASSLARDLHFRSQRAVPAPPSSRVVSSSAPFAGAEVEQQLSSGRSDRLDRLGKFGQALHGWQDSYSHQGEPASVRFCTPDYIWSHPSKRDGPYNTRADMTQLHVQDCMDAARTSYDLLVRMAGELGSVEASKQWSALQEDARSFCAAGTKLEKQRWFESHGTPQPVAIVRKLSIKNGSPNYYRRRDELNLRQMPDAQPPEPTQHPIYELNRRDFLPDDEPHPSLPSLMEKAHTSVSREVQNWYDRFFETLLTTPVSELPSAMGQFLGQTAPLNPAGGLMQMLLRVRAADRGLANDGAVLTLETLSSSDAAVSAALGAWQALLIRPRRDDSAYFASTIDGLAVAIAVFRHAPNEVLTIYVSHQGADIRFKDALLFGFH